MSAPARPFITCHVLETVSGRPAPDMRVTLSLLSPKRSNLSSPTTFTATTNSDGRVTAWQSTNDSGTSDLKSDEQMNWSLVFATEEFYGKGKTFWPEVELKFCTDKDERHYHVPLLLGPWSYTTYRGS
ncbi:Hydroxyisourate hydrolase [Aureobasidium namibiae CBS 147.97]|uniref:5-hydroxyisourate hydrolase n=1 Tax=Aureobasidium namibiae CBS 147.97 TaxID=1043004 RepID=A0A074XQV3_9PEZI|nr:Hydroxyisourate hydrolase [Aureobasidium namibiae CBS 147.97]KEQ76966.1 Hydroxyisourate hydrolase [Aureobasidium namibiae CBS 147.97]